MSELERWLGIIAANFGRNKNDEAKQRKVAVEYVRLCGYKNGEMGNGREKEVHNGLATKLTLDEIAAQLGTSKRDLQRALSIERNIILLQLENNEYNYKSRGVLQMEKSYFLW